MRALIIALAAWVTMPVVNGQTVPILEISRGDLEKRIEGVVGDSISGNSLEWRGSKGVEETPVDDRTAHVELDLQADVTGPNPSVDIGFDLQFANPVAVAKGW